MSKCKLCGKRGLFLKLDEAGCCAACAKVAQAIKRAAENERKIREALDAIERVPVGCDGEKVKKRASSNMPEIIFKNITKRSNTKKLSNFIVIDVETTGIKKTNKIIEVSALQYENFIPVRLFTTLINPEVSINDEVVQMTGITDSDVADSPRIYQVVPSLSQFIENSILVGHNLKFDLQFLYMFGVDFDSNVFYDTLELSQKVLKSPKYKCIDGAYEKDYDGSDWDVEDHKLGTLCDYYGICNPKAHRSASDCMATGSLFQKLMEEIIG